MYVQTFYIKYVLTIKLGLSMMAGVASNWVAFVGKDKKAVKRERPESTKVDEQGGQRPRYNSGNSTNEQGTEDHVRRITRESCDNQVVHTSNTCDEAT